MLMSADAGAVRCRGVRGATFIETDTPEAILTGTRELLAAIAQANGIATEDIASAFFTSTADLRSAFPGSIRAGQRATLTGRLVDANPDQVLSLRVDWGDGSPVEQRTPDRAPFRLTHRYQQPGTYKVFVMWSDGLGQSNFRELTLTVQPPPGMASTTATRSPATTTRTS
jgi:hypothetical protein